MEYSILALSQNHVWHAPLNSHAGKPEKIYVGGWLHLAFNAIWLAGFLLSLFYCKRTQGLILPILGKYAFLKCRLWISEEREWISHISKPLSPPYKESWLKDKNPPQDFQKGVEAHLL